VTRDIVRSSAFIVRSGDFIVQKLNDIDQPTNPDKTYRLINSLSTWLNTKRA
jgi:hypothetical protein